MGLIPNLEERYSLLKAKEGLLHAPQAHCLRLWSLLLYGDNHSFLKWAKITYWPECGIALKCTGCGGRTKIETHPRCPYVTKLEIKLCILTECSKNDQHGFSEILIRDGYVKFFDQNWNWAPAFYLRTEIHTAEQAPEDLRVKTLSFGKLALGGPQGAAENTEYALDKQQGFSKKAEEEMFLTNKTWVSFSSCVPKLGRLIHFLKNIRRKQ